MALASVLNVDTECIFCNDPLLEGGPKGPISVVTRGLVKIKTVSIEQKDNIWTLIGDRTVLKVHTECRGSYTRRAKKPSGTPGEGQSDRQSVPAPVLRSARDPTFNFKTCCFFCGYAAKVDERHPERKKVVLVRDINKKNQEVKLAASVRNVSETRADDWGRLVLSRVDSVLCLVAAEARYHTSCYRLFGIPGSSPPGPAGSVIQKVTRKTATDVMKEEAFMLLCDYIDKNDECQYKVKDLVSKFKELSANGTCYSEKQLVRKLEARYQAEIIVSKNFKFGTVVSFRGDASRILLDNLFSERERLDERMILEEAISILHNDIYSAVFDCDTYPSAKDIRSGGKDQIPKFLNFFLEGLMRRRTGTTVPERVRLYFANALIKAIRPKSYLSPAQIGLGVYLHRKFRSKLAIDVMAALGGAATYKEVLKYEGCAALYTTIDIARDAFIQFTLDNTDHNACTIDGHGTFHVMGNVMIVTPGAKVRADSPIPRLKLPPSTAEVAACGALPIEIHNAPYKAGLNRVTFQDVYSKSLKPENFHSVRKLDLLWASGPIIIPNFIPSWIGHMVAAQKDHDRGRGKEVSAIIAQPFVKLAPTKPTTVRSSLRFFAQQSAKYNQGSCIVTGDHPIYMKAKDIVCNAPSTDPISNITVRLGGFHHLMSYLSAVGHIMGGSGLEELWEVVYAPNTVPHMMQGKAYARAVRAHSLTRLALSKILLSKSVEDKEISEEQMHLLREEYKKVQQCKSKVAEILQCPALQEVLSTLQNRLEREAEKSRTGRLWVQYYKQIEIMHNFIRAERTGDWRLHLYAAQKMLPHLKAACHNNYVKASIMYMQDMLDLENKLQVRDYERFVEQGFFTVFRDEDKDCGSWPDLITEQVLMRSIKVEGGVTRGRGITDASLGRFIGAASATVSVVEAIEDLTGVTSCTSDQHVDFSGARQKRDFAHFQKIYQSLSSHRPFDQPPDQLVSLGTGVIADKTVNCDRAVEIGVEGLKKIVGKSFSSVQLQRKDKVINLASLSVRVKVGNVTG